MQALGYNLPILSVRVAIVVVGEELGDELRERL
jgi:hypothetical protein